MFSDRTKRIVVIRDIQSNMIEEAILILKSDREPAVSRGTKGDKPEGRKGADDYLLKEAEIIIDSYIKENKLKDDGKRKTSVKKVLNRTKWNINTWISISLIGSIALLLFLVSQFF